MARLLQIIMFIVLVALANLAGAKGITKKESQKPITLDYIYKKKDRGIGPVDPDLPRSLQWAKEGHRLAYLVSEATEPPHLLIYNPAENQNDFCITPFALHDAIESLKSQPQGVPLPSAPKKQSIPAEATNTATIRSYKWETGGRIHLHVAEKTYEWELDADRLTEREGKKQKAEPGMGAHAAKSPNNRYTAFIRNQNIHVYDKKQEKEIALTQDGGETILNGTLSWVYWEELHHRRGWKAFYWSPNNDAIAYLQFDERGVNTYPVVDYSTPAPKTQFMKYPKTGTTNPTVRLGVVSLSTRETRWIDLGRPYEYIARVAWLPQGDKLAVQAMPRDQDRLTLLFADPITGQSEVILEETNAKWVNVFANPIFLEQSQDFLWFSERSGYCHVYRCGRDGKTIKPLTKGPWEVDPRSLIVDEDNARVFFKATKASPVERHYYAVPIDGGPITRLTEGNGMHSLAFSADKQYALDRLSNAETPKELRVINSQGRQMTTLGKTTLSDYQPYTLQTSKIVEFQGPNGLIYYGGILKPCNFDPNKTYPAIIHMYAGPAGQVVTNRFVGMRDRALANEGYILFAFDTRGTAGRGRAWVNAVHKNSAEKPLQDLKIAADYLNQLPYVDGDRLGIWGWSNGGYMTCCAMTMLPGVFRAGVAVAPVTNFQWYDTIYTERYMERPQDNPEGYKNSAPVNFADDLQGELMLVHGISDDNVHVQNTYRMVDRLIEAGKDYQLYLYPERKHGIGGSLRQAHLYHRMFEFFARTLKQN